MIANDIAKEHDQIMFYSVMNIKFVVEGRQLDNESEEDKQELLETSVGITLNAL